MRETDSAGRPRYLELCLILLALSITATQVLFSTLAGRGDSWRERYLSLWTFDGGWYADIAEHGYRTSDPPVPAGHISNVAFFPSYPILARGIMRLGHLSAGVALLLTAQLAAVCFWWIILKLLAHWRVPSSISAAVVMTIFSHPAAFYLVVTYADSLFMVAVVLLLALDTMIIKSPLQLAGASLAGYLASLTRITGAPLAALPAIWIGYRLWPFSKDRFDIRHLSRDLLPHLLIACSTAFGTISFFLYCAFKFGHWDLYMRTRAAGWPVAEPDYTAPFLARNFHLPIPGFHQGFISAPDITHIYVAVLILSVHILPVLDGYWSWRRGRGTGFVERASFYLAAWLIFFFSASGAGFAHGFYLGFLRYGFHSHVPLVLAVAHARCRSHGSESHLGLVGLIAVFLLSALGMALQFHFCSLFTRETLVS